jgi:hypothetical protein
MTTRITSLALVAALLLGSGGVAAQEPPAAAGPIDQYQVDFKRKNLGRYLGIPQPQVEQLIQIDQKYTALKRQKEMEAKTALEQFKQLMNQPQPPEAEVQRILNHMMQKRQEKLMLEQQQFEEQKAVLPSAVQQGRYLLFLMGLHRQIAQEAQKLKSAPPATFRPPPAGSAQPVGR